MPIENGAIMRAARKYELTLLERIPHGGPTDRREVGRATVKADSVEQLASRIIDVLTDEAVGDFLSGAWYATVQSVICERLGYRLASHKLVEFGRLASYAVIVDKMEQ